MHIFWKEAVFTVKIDNKYKGIICIICSAFCFALMNILVRLSGDLPSLQKSFFRNFVAFIFAAAIMMKQGIPFKIEKGDLKVLILRAALGTVGIWCNFYAVDNMMVADASMLNKLSPFFVIIFSFFILKEKVKPVQIMCVIMAFVGMLFIIKPGFAGVQILPALVGTLGGITAGAAYTLVRLLSSRGVKGPLIVAFFSGFSCLAVTPFIIFDYHPMTAAQLMLLLGAGLAAAGGQFGITAAYSFAPAREISIYDYSQIIFATIFAFFILGETPDGYSFIGYAVICAASIWMFVYNNRKSNVEAAAK